VNILPFTCSFLLSLFSFVLDSTLLISSLFLLFPNSFSLHFHFIFLFILGSHGSAGENSGPKSVSNFRVNQNRILLLEIASFLNMLPESKTKKSENNFPSKNEKIGRIGKTESAVIDNTEFSVNEKDEKEGEKDVEKNVEISRNQLRILFKEGWTVSAILSFLSEKIVKKGNLILIHCCFVYTYFITVSLYFLFKIISRFKFYHVLQFLLLLLFLLFLFPFLDLFCFVAISGYRFPFFFLFFSPTDEVISALLGIQIAKSKK
jgi:hypothetical protein